MHQNENGRRFLLLRFIVEDTIEEVIRDKQKLKLNLAETMIDNPSRRNIRLHTNLGNDDKDIAEMLKNEARRFNKRKAED